MINAGDRSRAAIAGSEAAELYGGEILLEHVEDFRNNFTRFVLLSPTVEVHADNTTSTIALTIPTARIAVSRAGAVRQLSNRFTQPGEPSDQGYALAVPVLSRCRGLQAKTGSLLAGPLHAMDAELRYLGSCNSSRELHK